MKRPMPVISEDAREYWDACQRGEFLLQLCGACGNYQFPHRLLCSACGSRDVRAVAASGFGTIYSFTVVHRPPAEIFVGSTPYTVALVDLNEGPRLMTNIVGCPPEDVAIGMRVKVDFDGEGFRVPVFRPFIVG